MKDEIKKSYKLILICIILFTTLYFIHDNKKRNLQYNQRHEMVLKIKEKIMTLILNFPDKQQLYSNYQFSGICTSIYGKEVFVLPKNQDNTVHQIFEIILQRLHNSHLLSLDTLGEKTKKQLLDKTKSYYRISTYTNFINNISLDQMIKTNQFMTEYATFVPIDYLNTKYWGKMPTNPNVRLNIGVKDTTSNKTAFNILDKIHPNHGILIVVQYHMYFDQKAYVNMLKEEADDLDYCQSSHFQINHDDTYNYDYLRMDL